MLTIAPCVFLSAGCRGLGDEQRRAQIGADQIVPGRRRDLADGCRVERRGVVDEPVETSEALDGLVDDRRQLVEIEQVRLDQRDRVGADVVKLRLQEPRLAGGRAIMEHQVRAACVQPATDRCADTLGAAGDQHDPALHAPLPVDFEAI